MRYCWCKVRSQKKEVKLVNYSTLIQEGLTLPSILRHEKEVPKRSKSDADEIKKFCMLHKMEFLAGFFLQGYLDESEVRFNHIYNNMISKEKKHIIEVLKEHDIYYVDYDERKLDFAIYGIEDIRKYNEINIFVQQSEIQKAIAVLETCGYRMLYFDKQQGQYKEYDRKVIIDYLMNQYKMPPLLLMNGDKIKNIVNLYFRVSWGSAAIDDIFSFFEGQDSFDLTHQFIWLCLKNFKDLNTICTIIKSKVLSILPFLQIECLLLHHIDDIDFNEVLRYCKQFHILKPIYYNLYYNQVLFGSKSQVKDIIRQGDLEEECVLSLENFSVVPGEARRWKTNFKERLNDTHVLKIMKGSFEASDVRRILKNMPELELELSRGE